MLRGDWRYSEQARARSSQNCYNPQTGKILQRKDQKEHQEINPESAKESNMSYGTMSTVLRKALKMSPCKHVKKHQLSAHVVDKRLQRCKILLFRIQDGTLPNLVVSDEKKFDVEHHYNTQNDQVWSRNLDEGAHVLTRKQCPASVMVWAAVTESGRSPLFFVDQELVLNQQNYQDDILVGVLLP